MGNEPSEAVSTRGLGGLGEQVGPLENVLEALKKKIDAVYDRLGNISQPPSKLPLSLVVDVIAPCALLCYPHRPRDRAVATMPLYVLCTLFSAYHLC